MADLAGLAALVSQVKLEVEKLDADIKEAAQECVRQQEAVDAGSKEQARLTRLLGAVREELAGTVQEQQDLVCITQARTTSAVDMECKMVKNMGVVAEAAASATLEVEAFEAGALQFQSELCADKLERERETWLALKSKLTAKLRALRSEVTLLHQQSQAAHVDLQDTDKAFKEALQLQQGLQEDEQKLTQQVAALNHNLTSLQQQIAGESQGTPLQHLAWQHANDQLDAAGVLDQSAEAELQLLMDPQQAAHLQQQLEDELRELEDEAGQARCCIAVLQHEITQLLHPAPAHVQTTASLRQQPSRLHHKGPSLAEHRPGPQWKPPASRQQGTPGHSALWSSGRTRTDLGAGLRAGDEHVSSYPTPQASIASPQPHPLASTSGVATWPSSRPTNAPQQAGSMPAGGLPTGSPRHHITRQGGACSLGLQDGSGQRLGPAAGTHSAAQHAPAVKPVPSLFDPADYSDDELWDLDEQHDHRPPPLLPPPPSQQQQHVPLPVCKSYQVYEPDDSQPVQSHSYSTSSRGQGASAPPTGPLPTPACGNSARAVSVTETVVMRTVQQSPGTRLTSHTVVRQVMAPAGRGQSGSAGTSAGPADMRPGVPGQAQHLVMVSQQVTSVKAAPAQALPVARSTSREQAYTTRPPDAGLTPRQSDSMHHVDTHSLLSPSPSAPGSATGRTAPRPAGQQLNQNASARQSNSAGHGAWQVSYAGQSAAYSSAYDHGGFQPPVTAASNHKPWLPQPPQVQPETAATSNEAEPEPEDDFYLPLSSGVRRRVQSVLPPQGAKQPQWPMHTMPNAAAIAQDGAEVLGTPAGESGSSKAAKTSRLSAATAAGKRTSKASGADRQADEGLAKRGRGRGAPPRASGGGRGTKRGKQAAPPAAPQMDMFGGSIAWSGF